MIGLPKVMRVFLYVGVCDMRRQVNGLSNMVRESLERDPQNGDLYVFRNRRRDTIKILFFDRGGYCLLLKRLESGTFSIALNSDTETVGASISHDELLSLLTNARIERKMIANT